MDRSRVYLSLREPLSGRQIISLVNSYRVQLHLPAGGAAKIAVAGERARSAAEQLAREGIPVRWVRSVYVPEEERCFLLFEGPSTEAVIEASRRAALQYERIEQVKGDSR